MNAPKFQALGGALIASVLIALLILNDWIVALIGAATLALSFSPRGPPCRHLA
jgi:hypothetical protein